MQTRPVPALITLFLFFLVSFSSALSIPLHVTEAAGQARSNVPVQNGVPLPQGRFFEAGLNGFAIQDSVTGTPVSAGFWIVNKWPDNSIKFLGVNFPATLSANSVKTYLLTYTFNNPANSQLQVTNNGSSITVNTGKLKFTMKSAAFNIIDEAWVDLSGGQTYDDAHKVIAPGATDVLRTMGDASTGMAPLSIAYQNQEQVCIKAGQFSSGSGDHVYIVYVTAYRDKPYVKILHNWYYYQYMNDMNDLAMRFRTRVTNGTATFSSIANTGTKSIDVALSGIDSAYLQYAVADTYQVMKDGLQVATGRGQSAGATGSMDMGWVHLSNGTLGVGAGMRYFWEMSPRSLDAKADGSVTLGMYSSHGPTLTWYGGAGRTHINFLSFGTDVNNTKEAFYAVTRPLMAIPPAVYLCGISKAFGPDVVHADESLFGADSAARDAYRFLFNVYRTNHDSNGYASYKKPLEFPFEGLKDLHNFICFGDAVDPVNWACAGMQHFGNNYYDMPWLGALCYAMTADYNAALFGMERALQCADMDHNNENGDCMSCPGVRQFMDYQSCNAGYKGNTNHWKTRGIFAWSFIYAEPLLKDLGVRITRFPMNMFTNTEQARATGHAVQGLVAAYEATNDRAYLDRAEAYFTNGQLPMDSLAMNPLPHNFQTAMMGEGMSYLNLNDSGYANCRNRLIQWAMNLKNGLLQDATQPYPELFIWNIEGLSRAIDLAPPDTAALITELADTLLYRFLAARPGNQSRAKVQCQFYKAPPQYLRHKLLNQNYLNAYPDYIGIETQAGDSAGVAGTGLAASPNPFNPEVTLSVFVPQKQAFTLVVYDCGGRKVADLAVGVKNGRVIWNAARFASGVYVIKLTVGKKTVSRVVTLLK